MRDTSGPYQVRILEESGWLKLHGGAPVFGERALFRPYSGGGLSRSTGLGPPDGRRSVVSHAIRSRLSRAFL
ncbi:hypothetical protein BXY39_2049 [Eilatimonas milleporae]|uniref:Uncharacterized protein n=1 Tax=Eilatimonas milleporae TaxID=911205 RepID=A0A3M0CG46_9PROT|nr:hypothetical protein BXY39_2049 [Eilatimonas milleporae]